MVTTTKAQESAAPATVTTISNVAVAEAAHRLVVLVPSDLDNPAEYAHKINRLAVQEHRDVLFLALTGWEGNELSADRLLATLEALTRGSGFCVRTMQVHLPTWAAALNGVAQPGDLVVCLPEQAESAGVFRSLSLGQYIEDRFHCTVHVLSDQRFHASFTVRAWMRSLLFWLGTLAILAGFSFLEYDAGQFLPGAASTISIFLLFLVEVVLIYRWNQFTN